MTRKKIDINICLVMIFLLILFFPLMAKELSLGVQTQEMMSRENRLLPEFPPLIGGRFHYANVKRFPERMENYLTDTLPFRSQIISGIVQKMRESTQRQIGRGVFGINGWLYDNVKDGYSVNDFLGMFPLSEEDFIRHFTILNEKRMHFEFLGIKYYFFIAPNKTSVYPEFLPEDIQFAKGDSRLEQYMRHYYEYIIQHDVPDFIIVPTEALRQNKRDEFLYYPKDTHWNWTGRIVAGDELLDRLRRDFPDIGVIPNLMMHKQPGLLSLISFMNLSMPPKNSNMFSFPDEEQWHSMDIAKDGLNCTSHNTSPSPKRNAFFTGDSFLYLYQPMPEAFAFKTIVFRQRTGSILSDFKEYSKEMHFDIVVEERLEREFFIDP